MAKLSHTDEKGKANMVDIGDKKTQHRIAIAKGFIRLQPATIDLIHKNSIKKGEV